MICNRYWINWSYYIFNNLTFSRYICLLLSMWTHIYICVCVHHVYASAHRGQKSTLDPLELELHNVISPLTWLHGTKCQSFARTGYSLDLSTPDPSQGFQFLRTSTLQVFQSELSEDSNKYIWLNFSCSLIPKFSVFHHSQFIDPDN